jgi:hypothetical protein
LRAICSSHRPRARSDRGGGDREVGKAFIGEGEHAGEIKPGTARSKGRREICGISAFLPFVFISEPQNKLSRSLRRSSLGVS